MAERGYLLVSPCRNEAKLMRQTLDSVLEQTVLPAKWVIVDDGSTDETPDILAEYADKHDWITIVTVHDRGERSLGPGVVAAFYAGLDTVDLDDFDYLCKLDLDLRLPPRYFEILPRADDGEPPASRPAAAGPISRSTAGSCPSAMVSTRRSGPPSSTGCRRSRRSAGSSTQSTGMASIAIGAG